MLGWAGLLGWGWPKPTTTTRLLHPPIPCKENPWKPWRTPNPRLETPQSKSGFVFLLAVASHYSRVNPAGLTKRPAMGANSTARARKAIDAMKALGFSKKQATRVLKHLLTLFDKNWEPIEEDGYRALADAILDDQNNKQTPMPDTPIPGMDAELELEPEPEPYSTIRPDGQHPSSSASASRYDLDHNQTPLIKRPRIGRTHCRYEQSPKPFAVQDMSLEQIMPIAVVHQAADQGGPSGIIDVQNPRDSLFLTESKPEPETNDPADPNIGSSGGKNMLVKHRKTREMLTSGADAIGGTANHDQNRDSNLPVKNGVGFTVQNAQQAPMAELDVASSTMGEVKMMLKCNFDSSKVCISLDEVLKMVEDKCLHSYKILPPDFSIRKLMSEVCQYVAEVGSVHYEDQSNGGSLQKEAADMNVPFVEPIACKHAVSGNGNVAGGSSVPESAEPSLQNWIVACQPELPLSRQRPIHDVTDISKGEERVRISIVNEFRHENCPSSFYYIPKNLVFQNGYVNVSIARVGDEDCCSDCSGDCLSATLPCACARTTGGEFAYTAEGLVRAAFLDQCISVNHFPEKHNRLYCKSCPLERSKNQASPDPCKGHLARKFIKECWSKCGCGMQCGNRVIQRGITCNLQVFFTDEGKGWGLRTLDDLPKGAFICEYVGEILTMNELHERTVENEKNAKHVHQVLLDASWGSNGVSRDEEALCLDATFYGNVGRFANHRCYDPNLVLIPVEVETPDRHYYHLAFFTAKKVEAFEELTWDYGIDFDGKAFRCMCGSKYCRDPKNSRKRTRAGAVRN